jgi:hypothetical protein
MAGADEKCKGEELAEKERRAELKESRNGLGAGGTEEVERKTGSSMLLGSDDVVVDGEEEK